MCDRDLCDRDRALIEDTCNPLAKGTSFPALIGLGTGLPECPENVPPFMLRDGMCEMCDEVEGESDVWLSILAIIVGMLLGGYALYRLTGSTAGEEQATVKDAVNTRAAMTDFAASSEAKLVAGHVSSLVKIVTMQLQQSFSFISWKWGWPELLIDVRLWLGSFVLPDIARITNADCMAGGGEATMLMNGIGLPLLLFIVLVFVALMSNFMSHGRGTCHSALLSVAVLVGGVIGGLTGFVQAGMLGAWLGALLGVLVYVGCTRRKAKKIDGDTDDAENNNTDASEDESEAAARSANLSNFGWALFTLGSPIAVAGVCKLRIERPEDLVPALGFAMPFVLIIPLFAIWNLRKAKGAGILHSRAFLARYGWLCDRCVHPISRPCVHA